MRPPPGAFAHQVDVRAAAAGGTAVRQALPLGNR
jgi:hypothetical protein